MNTLVTILIRAGSKRLPGKEWKMLNGKPLYQWTFDIAKKWADENDADVIVLSKNLDIAKIAGEQYGFNSWERSDETSTDEAPKLDGIREALEKAENPTGAMYGRVVDLDVTAPLRTMFHITDAVNMAIAQHGDYSSVVSVVNGRRLLGFNHFIYNDFYGHDEFGDMKCDGVDLNASIYIYNANWLRWSGHKKAVTPETKFYKMPDWTFCDIDNQVDFDVVEMLQRKHAGELEIKLEG